MELNYTERLIRFNSSEKYKKEMEFLFDLIKPREGQRILDYGCGTGTLINFIKEKCNVEISGFDVQYLGTGEIPDWYINNLSDSYDTVYFMHSLAHIVDAESVLEKVKKYLKVSGKIVVITPNRMWDIEMKPLSKNYNPDTTVVKHFTPEELEVFFTDSGFKIELSGQFGKLLNGYNERIFLVATL
ncbi:MAG: class I SAM-dependent methyltransferase [Ignavibacteriales bacterium]|nr:MAG: class I SAM-dependent methyltransferase [Ignavibacteriales bacterium]